MLPPGETQLSDFERGFLLGLLIGEGHFGGDGRQPQITVRMHVRHEKVLRWLAARFPRSKLYGPYNHGDRHYFQWMARGKCLLEDVLPELQRAAEFDDHAASRIAAMVERYGLGAAS